MKEALEVVVLAGGGGTRLWPLSRRSRLKPLLPLAGGKSMLSRAVALGERIAGRGHLWIVASASTAHAIRGHLGPSQRARLIVEPVPRNTAPALTLAAATLLRRGSARWALCLPADQWIRKPASFASLVRLLVSRDCHRRLVTFGIPASSANPGYGYIELGERLGARLRTARRFVEKPAPQRARGWVRSGRWVWNSGMFLWGIEDFLAEAERLLPAVARAAARLAQEGSVASGGAARLWRSLPAISVDHGVLQRSRRVAVSPCNIGWCDLGSWEAVAAASPRAADGSRHQGRYLSIGGRDAFVYAPEHLTVNLGVQDVGLVVTRDAVLLFERRQHERVREVVERLRRTRGLERYL